MPKYYVNYKTTVLWGVEVEADNPEEAIETAMFGSDNDPDILNEEHHRDASVERLED
jgi:hypothetical protein